MPDLDSCLQIAKSAAFLAGDYLKEQQTKNLKILSKKFIILQHKLALDIQNITLKHILIPILQVL